MSHEMVTQALCVFFKFEEEAIYVLCLGIYSSKNYDEDMMCGHDFGSQETTSQLQVNCRLVPTCREEAGGRGAMGGLGEEPEGLIKTRHIYLQKRRHRQRQRPPEVTISGEPYRSASQVVGPPPCPFNRVT